MTHKKSEVLRILEGTTITNFFAKVSNCFMKTTDKDFLEHAKKEQEELESSMKSSRHQEYVRKQMDKIRAEGKMKEESVSDTHAIIKEAEKRVKTPSEKMQEELEPIPDLCPMTDE